MDEIARAADRIIVFDKGRIRYNAPPREIFSHSGELSEMGLAVPQATVIAARLRARGVTLPADIYTIEQLEEALAGLKGGGENA
jgi:energy-coupling factor transport system ATP-binding protein